MPEYTPVCGRIVDPPRAPPTTPAECMRCRLVTQDYMTIYDRVGRYAGTLCQACWGIFTGCTTEVK